MAARWVRSAALIVAATLAVQVAPSRAAGRQKIESPPWDTALLERWLAVADAHAPGAADDALRDGARWTVDELRQLWIDVQVLWVLVDTPIDERGDLRTATVRRLDFATRPTWVKVAPGRAANAALKLLVARVDEIGANVALRRGALVHTDVALLVPDRVDAGSSPMPAGAPQVVYVGDGQNAGAEAISLHWTLARLLIGQLKPTPGQDLWARNWYRAILGQYQQIGSFDSTVLRPALQLFPDDAQILLLAGCHREAMASPLFQEFARPYRMLNIRARTIGALSPGIARRGDELEAAERYFRRALRSDPTLFEARIRLGRVLSERGRHDDAATELRAALQAPLEPMLEYYAALYLGAALEGRGDASGAVEAYTRAAGLAPEAPVPQLALARLAQLRGDRQGQLAHLSRALAPSGDPQDAWWSYRAAQARNAAAWLDEVRRTWDREPR